ncbi:Protein MIG-38 [Aphelenchoides avenae]|nr:Protein MIG-38 [Aphelenchus avenae]
MCMQEDWFDTSFGNEVGGNGDDQHHHDFNSSMAGGSMALDVPMDDSGAAPMLQQLQTFHADASGQQQTLQQGYVQQMQPSTAQQYAAPDASRQQPSEFQTLQPYDPGPQQQQQQLVMQQQTQQVYYHQQQPSTSSAQGMTTEYTAMDSAYVNCQPTTSAAAPQTLQMNQPFDQQQILQSDQNVEYHQTAEGTWIAIHRAAPGNAPQQQQQQVHNDAQQQQHGGNMAQLMPLSNQHPSMQQQQQQPMQQQQRQPQQQYQQAPQHQQQQYAAEHKFVEIDGTQQTVVYAQQPQPQQRRSNDGQQILVTSMGQQRQVVQRQQIPQQQQTHHQPPPTSYTVVQQNGQQVTYVDQRSMVAVSGPPDQQQTQYIQSSQGSSGATYHAVQVLQPNGTVQTQMRLVQSQSQQQAVESKPPFQSLTGQPPPHPMTVKQPQSAPQQPQPPTTTATRPSRPPPKKKNNARAQQQPPQMQQQQIIHVQQAPPPPQQPDPSAVGEVLGKVAQSGGFVMSAENSAELARLGMLQSQLQEEQQMRGVDNSMRLQQIERDMLALLTGAMPVAASLQQAMSQPAPLPPAPAPQPVYVQQQQPPTEEKPKPAAKPKRPRPSRAKPKAPVNNQPPPVTKAEIVEPQMTIAQPNVIYVDTNGNPIQLPPGAIIQTVAPNGTFGTDDYSTAHNTQPSTSYSIIDTSTAQSQPFVAKPATSKAAQARARKNALAAAQNAQHQPAQLVVYATQQPASNVPTTCTVTVRNDPIGQPPPRPLTDRKVLKTPSPPKPKPIILPKPAELGKRIEEKRATRTHRLGNYFEGMRNSLQQTDYKSEFRDLSDAVSRLLPFSLLAEPDLSEAVVEQFDYEYMRHSMHMSERMGKVESRLRSIFLKEAMEDRDKDSELNMLLAMDVEHERRQLDADKKAASMDLESFVRGSELLRLPGVNEPAVKQAKSNLREPKSFGKTPQHYEFHEFDPERYRSISPLPTSPAVVENLKSESDSEYSSDEELSIQSPPKPWQRSAEKLTFGSPKETLAQPPMPQRLPTPSSLLPNETIVWEPEPIRPRSSAQDRAMPPAAPMPQKRLETPPPLAKAKSPEGMQPALSPQSMALQSQSHLPMKLRMKSLSMLKPLSQRRPEPPAVVEAAPPRLTLEDAVANTPSVTVPSETVSEMPSSETPPKPKVQPPERPIMTVRPMVKGRDEITRSMTASLQRIADRLPQPAGPQSDNKAYGIEESDSDEERANDEPKKPLMLKINLKKPHESGKEQVARADNGEDEEAERKRRKKERKEEKKRKKKEGKSKKEERRRLRELQAEQEDEPLAKQPQQQQPPIERISLKLSAKAGQPLHVEKAVSNNVQVSDPAPPSEQRHVEKIRIPRPVETKPPPAAAEEPPKQKLTLNFKKLLAARNTASSEDVAQKTFHPPPPPMVQQHHAQVPVARPQLIAEDPSEDWPLPDKKKKRGAKNSSDEDSDWEASRKGRNKKTKHGKQPGKPEKKARQSKKASAPSLDTDAASPPKRPRLVMKLGRPPPASESVTIAPPLSSFAGTDVPTVQKPPEPLKMKPLKIKIGGKVPKPPSDSPKETKSPGLPGTQRPHATTPSVNSHRPGFSFFATSKAPASKANAKKSSQPSVGRSASSSSKRDVAQQPPVPLPRQPSMSVSQLSSAPPTMPRQCATPAMHQSMPSTPLLPSVATTPHAMPTTPQSMPYSPHPVTSQQFPSQPNPVARPPSVHEPLHPPPPAKDAFRSSSTARSFMEQSDPNFPSHGASGFDDTLFASRERIQFSPCSDEEVDQLHKQTSDVLKKLGIKR